MGMESRKPARNSPKKKYIPYTYNQESKRTKKSDRKARGGR